MVQPLSHMDRLIPTPVAASTSSHLLTRAEGCDGAEPCPCLLTLGRGPLLGWPNVILCRPLGQPLPASGTGRGCGAVVGTCENSFKIKFLDTRRDCPARCPPPPHPQFLISGLRKGWVEWRGESGDGNYHVLVAAWWVWKSHHSFGMNARGTNGGVSLNVHQDPDYRANDIIR